MKKRIKSPKFSFPGLFLLMFNFVLIVGLISFGLKENWFVFIQAEDSSPKTTVFQQGVNNYNGATSTYIFSWYPEKNFVKENRNLIYTNSAYSLIKFDLTSLPQNAKVEEASLTLCAISKYGSSVSPLNISAFQVLKEWTADNATWYQAENGIEWEKAGVQGTIADRNIVSLDNITISELGCYSFSIKDAVQQWLNYPQTNKGILLASLGGGGVGYFFADESYPHVSSRPKLTIEYNAASSNNIPPYISFDFPHYGSFITETEIKVNVQDDKQIGKVEYYLDNQKIATINDSPYSFSLSTSQHELGSHVLTARVYDDLGQTDEESILVHFYREEEGVLTLVQVSDVHIESNSSYPPIFTKIVKEINDIIKPAVIIDSGDLVTSPSLSNYQAYENIIKSSKIPFKIIPGNHDLTDGGTVFKNTVGNSKEKLYFDLGNYRIVGIGCYKIAKYQEWVDNSLSGKEGKGIIFSHYPVVLPPQRAMDSLLQMSKEEKEALLDLFESNKVLFYLSGHTHERFLMEEPTTLTPNLSVLSTTQKSGYEIITIDDGIISSTATYLNENPRWPVLIITSPQQFYGGSSEKTISGKVKIRAKIFDDSKVEKAEYKIDSGSWKEMVAKTLSFYEGEWDTEGASGVHTVYVRASDVLGREKTTQIEVKVATGNLSPTPVPPVLTPAPTPTLTPTPGPSSLILEFTSGTVEREVQDYYQNSWYFGGNQLIKIPKGYKGKIFKVAVEVHHYGDNTLYALLTEKTSSSINSGPQEKKINVFGDKKEWLEFEFDYPVDEGKEYYLWLKKGNKSNRLMWLTYPGTILTTNKNYRLHILPEGSLPLPTSSPTMTPTLTPTPPLSPTAAISPSCPSSCPQITSYSSGKEGTTCWVEISWKPVANAQSYKIWRNNALFRETTQTTYRWRWLSCNNNSLYKVQPLAPGCPEVNCGPIAILTPF